MTNDFQLQLATDMSEAEIWQILETIPDPEIPAISIVELGVVRKVDYADQLVNITITPTYSGCPAMKIIEIDITAALVAKGLKASITTTINPAWTTDWMSPATKEKLKAFGIAPPSKAVGDKVFSLLNPDRPIECPRCNSTHTKVLSDFGSTACKALWFCEDCKEPFDYFKCH